MTATIRRLPWFLAGLLAAALVVPAVADVLDPPAPDPLPRVAFVARNDVPNDALAVGPVAGALGGVLFTTPPSHLSDEAEAGLVAFSPEVVYVAGGSNAITPATYEAIDSAGSWETRRLSGTNRDDTAAKVAGILDDLGVGRPLVTGGQVVGDAWLGGALTTDVSSSASPTIQTWAARDSQQGDAVSVDSLTTLEELIVDVPADGVLLVTGTSHVSIEGPMLPEGAEVNGYLFLDPPSSGVLDSVFASSAPWVEGNQAQGRGPALVTGAVAITAGEHVVRYAVQASTSTADLASLSVTFMPGTAPAAGYTVAP